METMKMLTTFGGAWLAAICLSLTDGPAMAADNVDDMFQDPTLRRCLYWLLTGTRGALIEPLCTGEYQIPPPSLFLCARKVETGFESQTDLEACAIIFDEEAKKVRSGYVRHESRPEM
jgi:hypothetical protein